VRLCEHTDVVVQDPVLQELVNSSSVCVLIRDSVQVCKGFAPAHAQC